MECNAVIDSQYSRGETIASNPVPAEIKDDLLEEYICKALLLTGGNIIPDYLQDCHWMKMLEKVTVKLKMLLAKINHA